MMQAYWETETHEVDYHAGYLVIAESDTQKSFVVQLHDNNGRNVTRKQFTDAASTHGIDRACSTFKKLAEGSVMDDWKEWVKDTIGVVSLFLTFYLLFFFAGVL